MGNLLKTLGKKHMLWKGTKTDYLKIIGEREDPQENCLNKVIGILYDLDLYEAYPEIETLIAQALKL